MFANGASFTGGLRGGHFELLEAPGAPLCRPPGRPTSPVWPNRAPGAAGATGFGARRTHARCVYCRPPASLESASAAQLEGGVSPVSEPHRLTPNLRRAGRDGPGAGAVVGFRGCGCAGQKGGSLPPGSPPATCYASDLTAVPAVLRARQGSCFRCVCGRAPSKLRSLRMPRKVCRRLNPPSRLGTPACDRSHAGRAEEKWSRDGETQAKGAGADTARAYEQGAERRGRGRFGSFAVASSTTFCHTHSHFADGFWLFVFLSTLNLLDGFCRSGAAAGTPRRRLRRLQWQRAYVRGKTGRQRAEQSDVGPRDGGMTWRGGAVT